MNHPGRQPLAAPLISPDMGGGPRDRRTDDA
jgi:hypothetical protein